MAPIVSTGPVLPFPRCTLFSLTALCPLVRLDIWEKGNISLLQLSERLRSTLRHALCDALMEFRVLPNPLCMEPFTEPEDQGNVGKSLLLGWHSSQLPLRESVEILYKCTPSHR